MYTAFATKNLCYIKGVRQTPRRLVLHSTGANNPRLGRYCRSDNGAINAQIGIVQTDQHMNTSTPGGRKVCPHGFIGLDASGSVEYCQILPYTIRGWHVGSDKGNSGSIGIEICEDGLTDRSYFTMCYEVAVDVFAGLCKKYKIDPLNGIYCHAEMHRLGMGSNHGDVEHWFPKHGKSMDDFRRDVKGRIDFMEIYVKKDQSSEWASDAWEWAKTAGLMDGTRPHDPLTREEMAVILQRLKK